MKGERGSPLLSHLTTAQREEHLISLLQRDRELEREKDGWVRFMCPGFCSEDIRDREGEREGDRQKAGNGE